MENASKALIIAGEILLGIMILTILSYTFTKAGSFANQQYSEAQRRELQAFNQQYQSFMRNDLKASDILSVINMAKNNNKEIADDTHPSYIKISVKITDGPYNGTYNEKTTVEHLYNRFMKYYSVNASGDNIIYEPDGDATYTNGRISEIKFKKKV